MTLKEYLGIDDNQFTISNEYLFIHHKDGEEFVMNLKTKKSFKNHNIEDTSKSLANLFNIPITNDHFNALTHNNLTIYKEIYKHIPNNGIFYKGSEHSLHYHFQIQPYTDRLGNQLDNITTPKNFNYKINKKETLNNNLTPTGYIENVWNSGFNSNLVYAPYLTATQMPNTTQTIEFTLDSLPPFIRPAANTIPNEKVIRIEIPKIDTGS
jgi:hypothetical protein